MADKIRVADYVADFLAANAIRHVFTVTGGGAMHLNDALGKHPRLKCIYNHHEQASAIAAEGYARLSGKIAAVCVTTGPGGTNAITGVMGGYLDSIPMLIISGQVRYDTTVGSCGLPLRQLGDQEFNITASVANMTKYAVMVTDPKSIRYHLERALYIATHGRRGPCWVDIPLNIQATMIDPDELYAYDCKEDEELLPPKVTAQVADDVLARIQTAKRPVLYAGSGIRLSGAHAKFIDLAEKLGIPVVTAWNAHDTIWNEHPLYAGRPGINGDRGGNFVVQNSDLILVVGCRLSIRQVSYNWKMFAHGAYKIMVDIDATEMEKPTLSIDQKIHADAADFIEVMLERVQHNPIPPKAEWLRYAKEMNANYPVTLPEYYEKNAPVNPYCFFDTLFPLLGEDDVVVSGNGSACVCSFQAAMIKRHMRLFTNSGCASMGYGLPAAMGACVSIGRRVICLEGDGSLQMNLQELQTVAHYRLPLKVIVLNNNGYHSIRQTQQNFFGMPLVGVGEESGVGFAPIDKLANAFGIAYYRIGAHNQMQEVIEQMLSEDGPAIIEVMIDQEQLFLPKLASKRLEDGSMYSPPLEDLAPFLPRDEFEANMKISKE